MNQPTNLSQASSPTLAEWWESLRRGGHYSFASHEVTQRTGDVYFQVRAPA